MTNSAKKISSKQAKLAGTEDGRDAVLDVYNEQGIDALRRCQQPGSVGWDEHAINFGVAEISLGNCLSDNARRAYYKAYQDAADELAEQLLRDAE